MLQLASRQEGAASAVNTSPVPAAILGAGLRPRARDGSGRSWRDFRDSADGKPFGYTRREPVGVCAVCAQVVPGNFPGDGNLFGYTYREPMGVCAVCAQVVAWNFPLLTMVWKIGPR